MEFNVLVRRYAPNGGRGQQALDLGDGQRGHAAVGGCLLVGVVGQDGLGVGGFGQGRCDGQQCVGGQGEGGVPLPGPVAAYLGFVEPDSLFGVLEVVFDRPAGTGDLDQIGEGADVVLRDVGDVVGQFARIADLPADQQVVARGRGGDPGPVVQASALGPVSA